MWGSPWKTFIFPITTNHNHMKLYSLYDSRAGMYLPPFVARNAELAKRLVAASLLTAKDIPPAEYPADFNVFEVAEFDEEKGFRPLPGGQVNIGNVLAILTDFRRRVVRSAAVSDDKKNEYDENHV